MSVKSIVLFDWFKKRKAAKARVIVEAEFLISMQGAKAFSVATANALNAQENNANSNELKHYFSVRSYIRRKHTIPYHTDTATRYLMND
jgi:hypothetical protein